MAPCLAKFASPLFMPLVWPRKLRCEWLALLFWRDYSSRLPDSLSLLLNCSNKPPSLILLCFVSLRPLSWGACDALSILWVASVFCLLRDWDNEPHDWYEEFTSFRFSWSYKEPQDCSWGYRPDWLTECPSWLVCVSNAIWLCRFGALAMISYLPESLRPRWCGGWPAKL